MRFWRISNYSDLSGRGGLISAGRWHKAGIPVVYMADHPATAMLETLAHLNLERVPGTYRLNIIEVPDGSPSHRVDDGDLPSGWEFNLDVTQRLGFGLLDSAKHLLIVVPSVLVPGAWNALLNPRHVEAGRCAIIETIARSFDRRLVR